MSDVELKGLLVGSKKDQRKNAELFKTYKDGQVLRIITWCGWKVTGAKVRTKDKDFRCEGEVKTLFGMQNFRHKTTSKQKSL